MRLSSIGSINIFGLKVRTSYAEWAGLQTISPPPLIVDVGVAYGTPVLHNMFPDAELILVEPLPIFHDYIEKKILSRRNGRLVKCAAGAEKGSAEIIMEKADPLRSSFLERSALTKMQQEKSVITVDVDTLDNILADVAIRPGSLLKIDTEGFEMETLKGAKETLRKFDYVITEASVMERFENSYRMPELISYMQGEGYMLETMLAAPIDKRGLIRVADLLFKAVIPAAR